jgi:DNA/RNA-binding domain of Phe-tRNA-synthetase-like protein
MIFHGFLTHCVLKKIAVVMRITTWNFMSIKLSISDIAVAFSQTRIAVVIAEDLIIAPERSAALDDLIREREAAARAQWADFELSQIPGIAAWRQAYKAFGIKQTRYRSSVERIVKNVLADRELSRINAFVDLYNAVSLQHVLPLGADDLDKVVRPLAFRYARDGDSFVDMAEGANEFGDVPDQPKPGEVVFADAEKVLCRRWNWRQDARSLITPQTERAIVTLQSNGWGDVEAAATDLADLISRFCRGQCRTAFLSASQPNVEI